MALMAKIGEKSSKFPVFPLDNAVITNYALLDNRILL